MKNAAVENTQPTLGQLCVLKEGLDLLGEALAGLRRMGLFQPTYQLGQCVHGGRKVRRFLGVLPCLLIGDQIGCPLEQQGKEVVKPLLVVGHLNQMPPVISHPMEAAGEVIELFSGGFAVSAVGQVVQQLGKAQQAAGNLAYRIG